MAEDFDLNAVTDRDRARLLTEALRGYTAEMTAELFGRYSWYRGAPTVKRLEDALVMQRARWSLQTEDGELENLTPPETLRAAFGDPLERLAIVTTKAELASQIADDPQPVLGYELVKPTDEAVEMCGYLVHVSVQAMNDAYNEPTLPWDDNRQSVIDGVRRVIDNPRETPEQNHEAWREYKAKGGWVLGPVKDAKLKTHPCMVPYSMLSPSQRQKDMVFLAIVRAMFGDGRA